MDKSKNNYKYIIAVSSFILMAIAFSIVNSVNTILTAPVINARNFSIGEFSLLFTITAIMIIKTIKSNISQPDLSSVW